MERREPWPRETLPGYGLRKSSRTIDINFDLPADQQQLWSALSIHWEMPLNAVAAWAIRDLAKNGVKDGRRPLHMGVGLKHPKKKYQAANKYSKAEWDMWDELKRKYAGGWAGVLTVALIELYWREPVDLSIANVPAIKRRQTAEEGQGDELAV